MRLEFERLRTLDKVLALVDGITPVDFRSVDRDEAYELIRRALSRFGYASLDGRARAC